MPGVRRLRSLERRAKLLAVAQDLFLAKGYDLVTVDEIVERAGGSKTNVYQHFGSKSVLLREVVSSLTRKIVPSIPVILDEDIAVFLGRSGRKILGQLLTNKSIQLHRLVVAQSAEHPAVTKRFFREFHYYLREELASRLSPQQQRGRIKAGMTPNQLAETFLSMLGWEQLLRQMVTGTHELNSREIVKLVDDAVSVFTIGALSARTRSRR